MASIAKIKDTTSVDTYRAITYNPMSVPYVSQSTKLKVASWTNGDLWPFTDNQTFIDADIPLPGQEPDAFTTAKHFRFMSHRYQIMKPRHRTQKSRVIEST